MADSIPPNLYQRDGIWWARIQVRGRDVRRSLRTGVKAEAKQRLKALLAEAQAERAAASGLPSDAAERTWREAVSRYLSTQLSDLRPRTRDRYECSIRMMHPHFGELRLRQITPARVNEYVTARLAAGASPATVRRDLTVAARVFKVAIRAGWVASNPIPDEKGELVERREPVQPVPLRRIAQVLRHAPPGLAALIRFAAKTGCRQEEAAGLERQHVDFTAGTITFARTKTASPRVIPMTPSTHRLLAHALAAKGGPEQPVFRNREGSRFQGMPSRWRELVRAAGVPRFRMHDLRHTYAIRWLQAGGSIYPLSRRLGHSTVRTTEIYAGWLTDRAH